MHGLLVQYGAGKHTSLQSPSDLINSLKIVFGARLNYTLVTGLTKLSICLCYLRLFQDPGSRFIMWGLTSFILSYTVIFAFVFVFQCTPISYAWQLEQFDSHCGSVAARTLPPTALNIISDILLISFFLWQISKSLSSPSRFN